MMTQQKRICKKCKYPVTFCNISDHYDYVQQFVSTGYKGKLKGIAITTDNCPKCNRLLTLKSTAEVIEK